MSTIINANDVEMLVVANLKDSIKQIANRGVNPEFYIINASDNPANKVYIKNKVKTAEQIGLKARVVEFGPKVRTEDVLDYVLYCNDNDIPVIIQLPMYEHLDKDMLIYYLNPQVDADGFTNEWIGRTYMSNVSRVSRVQPATAKGVMGLLDFYEVEYQGKIALVIGTGKHTGQCIANMLMNEGATVITANEYTPNINKLVKQADIIISCVGKQGIFDEYSVKPYSTVIGVGFSYVNGKQVQDFDENKLQQCEYVSSRINCTGKMTILALMDNIVELYKRNLGL